MITFINTAKFVSDHIKAVGRVRKVKHLFSSPFGSKVIAEIVISLIVH